jgi:ankyrin repeat protein
VNAREVDGATALRSAVNRDDLQTVEVPLGVGANAKAVNRYGVSPLLIACNSASAPVVREAARGGLGSQ